MAEHRLPSSRHLPACLELSAALWRREGLRCGAVERPLQRLALWRDAAELLELPAGHPRRHLRATASKAVAP